MAPVRELKNHNELHNFAQLGRITVLNVLRIYKLAEIQKDLNKV